MKESKAMPCLVVLCQQFSYFLDAASNVLDNVSIVCQESSLVARRRRSLNC
jgi:hypothetical protein